MRPMAAMVCRERFALGVLAGGEPRLQHGVGEMRARQLARQHRLDDAVHDRCTSWRGRACRCRRSRAPARRSPPPRARPPDRRQACARPAPASAPPTLPPRRSAACAAASASAPASALSRRKPERRVVVTLSGQARSWRTRASAQRPSRGGSRPKISSGPGLQVFRHVDDVARRALCASCATRARRASRSLSWATRITSSTLMRTARWRASSRMNAPSAPGRADEPVARARGSAGRRRVLVVGEALDAFGQDGVRFGGKAASSGRRGQTPRLDARRSS